MTTTRKPRKPLTTVVGTACAALLCTQLPQLEGLVLTTYADPVGVLTVCSGHTLTAKLGQAYTPEECQVLLQEDLVDHAEGVLACVPSLAGNTGPLSAAVSFTFNVGTGAFCRSTMARKFNAGDIAGGCAELSRWTRAGGKELKGLVRRRATERAICESTL